MPAFKGNSTDQTWQQWIFSYCPRYLQEIFGMRRAIDIIPTEFADYLNVAKFGVYALAVVFVATACLVFLGLPNLFAKTPVKRHKPGNMIATALNA